MTDIDRKARTRDAFHNVHTHTCPECGRPYSCNCSAQSEKDSVVCIDCEHGVGPTKEEKK